MAKEERVQHLAELESMEVYTPPAPGEFPPLLEAWGWGGNNSRRVGTGGKGEGSNRGDVPGESGHKRQASAS